MKRFELNEVVNCNTSDAIKEKKILDAIDTYISSTKKSVKMPDISPIDGLSLQEFEKMRDQIIQYIKMYSTDGEPIGAYKIMKLFEPFIKQ